MQRSLTITLSPLNLRFGRTVKGVLTQCENKHIPFWSTSSGAQCHPRDPWVGQAMQKNDTQTTNGVVEPRPLMWLQSHSDPVNTASHTARSGTGLYEC